MIKKKYLNNFKIEPFLANSSASAQPIPEVAPVTITTRPLKFLRQRHFLPMK